MGEMLHYFIVSGKEDFDFYRDTFKAAFTEKDALSGIINKSLEIKKRYIEIDEFDKKNDRFSTTDTLLDTPSNP